MMKLQPYGTRQTQTLAAMYDTIDFSYTRQVGDTDLPRAVLPRLQDVSEHTYQNGRTRWTGRLANYNVSVTPLSVKVSHGSLSRFYAGSNNCVLTPSTTRDAITRLSDSIGLDMSAASVTAMHTACNMQMDYPPATYFPLLGSMEGADRNTHKGTLYYNDTAGARAVVFYDKAREMRAHGQPSAFPSDQLANLLRMETRYNNTAAVQTALQASPVTGATLYDDAAYKQAVKAWRDSICAIRMSGLSVVSLLATSTDQTDLLLTAFGAVLQAQGVDTFKGIVKSAASGGNTQARQRASRFCKLADKAAKAFSELPADARAKELLTKIAQAAAPHL